MFDDCLYLELDYLDMNSVCWPNRCRTHDGAQRWYRERTTAQLTIRGIRNFILWAGRQ